MPAPKIPLSLAPINLPASISLGTLRHVLTTVGGYWIATGLTTMDSNALKWGAGMTAAGFLWSYADKIIKRVTGREVPPSDPG